MTDIGGVVYVPLVEPEKYMSRPASAKYTLPRGFPWTHPVSSNSAVLKPVAVCKEGLVFSGLPVEPFAFRAVGPGMATISAALTAQWRAANLPRNTVPKPYRLTITVRP